MGIVARENKGSRATVRSGEMAFGVLPAPFEGGEVDDSAARASVHTHPGSVFGSPGNLPAFSSQKSMRQVYLRASEFRAG